MAHDRQGNLVSLFGRISENTADIVAVVLGRVRKVLVDATGGVSWSTGRAHGTFTLLDADPMRTLYCPVTTDSIAVPIKVFCSGELRP